MSDEGTSVKTPGFKVLEEPPFELLKEMVYNRKVHVATHEDDTVCVAAGCVITARKPFLAVEYSHDSSRVTPICRSCGSLQGICAAPEKNGKTNTTKKGDKSMAKAQLDTGDDKATKTSKKASAVVEDDEELTVKSKKKPLLADDDDEEELVVKSKKKAAVVEDDDEDLKPTAKKVAKAPDELKKQIETEAKKKTDDTLNKADVQEIVSAELEGVVDTQKKITAVLDALIKEVGEIKKKLEKPIVVTQGDKDMLDAMKALGANVAKLLNGSDAAAEALASRMAETADGRKIADVEKEEKEKAKRGPKPKAKKAMDVIRETIAEGEGSATVRQIAQALIDNDMVEDAPDDPKAFILELKTQLSTFKSLKVAHEEGTAPGKAVVTLAG